MAEDELIDALNRLIEQNKDSAKGFLRAQNDVTDEDLSDLFDSLAAQRVEMVDALQQAVRRLGGEPQEKPSATGALERGWLNIKAAMTIEHEKTDAIVLADRAEHEAEVVAVYEELLGRSLPSPVQELLSEQYRQAREVQQRLAHLEQEVGAEAD